MIGLTAESTPLRDIAEVAAFARRCFQPAADRTDVPATGDRTDVPAATDRVGVELEFLVVDRADPAGQVPLDRVRRLLPAELPGGSRVTFEPGGQVELSGPAGPLPDAVARMAADVAVVRGSLRAAGLSLSGVGLDPVRPARRQLDLPRYAAMAEYLGVPYGALMMCSTASVQINLDLGERPAERWERAHAFGPVLLAAFANSPLSGGRPCGWMSGRQAVWDRLDPTRTMPVPVTGDPAADWAAYLLDARLMLVREHAGHYRPVRDGSTFRDWLERGAATRGGPSRTPTLEDLAYHATTVFPPVRPRGWLEIRYLDAQHPDLWPVCAAVTHALVTDDRAAVAAMAALEPSLLPSREAAGRRGPWEAGWDASRTAGRGASGEAGRGGYREACRGVWERAARCGLADPRLRTAAEAGFRAALEALPRLGAGPELVGAVAAFADRHVSTGRSPAAYLLPPAPRHPTPARPAGTGTGLDPGPGAGLGTGLDHRPHDGSHDGPHDGPHDGGRARV
ncbi:glutamate-cysteine ligase family protein [Nonomuraea candida]|uniref:glutamate-cysteine ligase family protein n=1 Tax=Nonomuraea candida TaxID=359159 RepID=UPI0009FF29D1|nr:glutamate-cysteine ligase family protein [Nonomuraea candida]